MRRAIVLLFAAGCADLVGADFGDRELREAAGGAGAGAGAGGQGASGGGGNPSGGGNGPCPGTCVEVPTDWEGPVTLSLGAPPLADCAALGPFEAAFEGLGSLDAPPANCSPCTCNAGAVTCGVITIDVFSDTMCNVSDCGGTFELDESVCATPVSCTAGPIRRVSFAAEPTAQGMCNEVPAVPTLIVNEPPSFDAAARACRATSTQPACPDANDVCLPAASGDVHAACVHRTGAHACPPGFDEKFEVAQGFDDQRGCAMCTCGLPSCSVASIDLSDDACDLPSTAMGGAAACLPIIDSTPGAPNGLGWTVAKECTPGGGGVTGEVELTDLRTVCCTP
jgi:hypothetical protein